MTRGVLVALAMIVAAPAVQAQPLTPEAQRRRNQIHVMEGVLARAGSIAAEAFGRQLQQIEPTMSLTIGGSRARGFVLEGYGVFFDVEVPELSGTITMILPQLMIQRDLEIGQALAVLKRTVESLPEGQSRQQALKAWQVLDFQAGPLPALPTSQSFREPAQDPAVKVSEGTAPADDPRPLAAPAAQLSPELLTVMKNPRRVYRDTVQRELTDVMLEYSHAMDIAPDEWLAVAARVTEAGQRGNTLMLRIKGSDLAVFAADKSRREEIRKKVEVQVF